MSLTELLVTTLALVVLLVALGALIWWLRTQAGAATRGFYNSVWQMEQDQGVHDRYQSPWLLLLGDEEQGAQLCANWQLTPAGKAGWFGRWWADSEGAVLVVPQVLFMPGEGMSAPLNGWWRLLGLLLRLRASRPLDGLIWSIPAASIWTDDPSVAQGGMARRKFIDLLQRLGLSLPVYVVITGMEEVAGFQELIRALPREAHEQALGWSSPYAPDATWQSNWSDLALGRVSQALAEAIIEIGALSGQLSEDLYRLPEQFDAARGNLQSLLEPVFQGNAQGESPRFRGLYFTASQALTPADETALYAHQSLFARSLWRERIIAERGLAQAVPRILRLRQRWQRVVGASAAVLGGLWLGAMLWVWQAAVDDADALASLLQKSQSRYVVEGADKSRKGVAKHNIKVFWSLLEHAPRWHYSSLAFPTSWFSSLDDDLDEVLQSSARRQLYLPLHGLLQADLQALGMSRLSGRRSNLDGDEPEQWQNYVQAKALLAGAMQLEQQNTWFGQALNNDKAPLDDLTLVANSALELELNAGTLRKRTYYNRVLRDAPPPGMAPLNLQEHRPLIAEHFRLLMRLWLTQFFLADNFVVPAGYLKQHVQKLQAGYGNSLEELDEVDGLIESLRELIALSNSAWSRGSDQDLVPGYQALLKNVRQNALLGPVVEQEINNEAARLQKSFRDQWIAQGGTGGNLLYQQSTGSIALQDDIIGLDKAIESLLRRDFVVSARRADMHKEQPRGFAIDNEAVTAALGYYASHQEYDKLEMPLMPAAYRTALAGSANKAAATAMWHSLASSSQPLGLRDKPAFKVAVDQALDLQRAFSALGRQDLSAALVLNLNQRALLDVDRALVEIDALPVFRQAFDIGQWDGTQNLSQQLFRAANPQELKQGLAEQYKVMLGATQSSAPALEWLLVQYQHLTLDEEQKVARLNALGEEMLKYKADNPSSAPAQFEQLVSRDFSEMDLQSCARILQAAALLQGSDDLSQYGQRLRNQAMQRCNDLQQQSAAIAWHRLADYFNQYLAGRFPFSYDTEAADANPQRVRYLMQLIDENLVQAEAGLQLSRTSDALAAQDFLGRLKQARTWLGPLLLRDKEGVLGLEVDIRWRTERDQERGADQVIAWGLDSNSQEIRYPGDEAQRLRWSVGEPLKLSLRWAKNGSQRPANDPRQPNLAVLDHEAGWEYEGSWALMKLVRSHISQQRQPNVDYTEFPLKLELPVHAPYSSETQALMFMQVSLLAQGGKAPLSIQPLPVRAPRSPFTPSDALAPLAQSEPLSP